MSSFDMVSIRFYNARDCSGQYVEKLNEPVNTCKTGYSSPTDSYAFLKTVEEKKDNSECNQGSKNELEFASLKPETCFATAPSQNPSMNSSFTTAISTNYKAYSYHVKSVPHMANSVTYDNVFDAGKACAMTTHYSSSTHFRATMNKYNQCMYYCRPKHFASELTGKIINTADCDPYNPITKGPVYANKPDAAKACDEKAASNKNNKVKEYSSSTINGQCTYICRTDKVNLKGSCDGISAEQREIEKNRKPTKGPVYADIDTASKACDERAAGKENKGNKRHRFSYSQHYKGNLTNLVSCTYLCSTVTEKIQGFCDGKEHSSIDSITAGKQHQNNNSITAGKQHQNNNSITAVKQHQNNNSITAVKQHQNNNSAINTLGIFTGLLAFMINIY
eukprot:Pgem_evm1s19052